MSDGTEFEMTVSGKGMLQGMWISRSFKRYGKDISVFDHSATFLKHQDMEAQIGEKYGDKDAKASAKRIRANQATRGNKEVDVEFAKQGKDDVAIVSGNGKRRVVKLNMDKLEAQGLDHAMEEIGQAVDEILGRKPKRPIFIQTPSQQAPMS